MAQTPIFNRIIENDDDIDLKTIREEARYHEENGHHKSRAELVGAIENHIASQLMGWGKYEHLDEYTKSELRAEIRLIADEMADEIQHQFV